jgi:hypothetical protein
MDIGMVDTCFSSYTAGTWAATAAALPKGLAVRAIRSAPTLGKYSVGAYNTLKSKVKGLDAHHVGQSALMKK